MKKNKIIRTKTADEIRQLIKSSNIGFDADFILQEADKERQNFKGPTEIAWDTNYYKAMTLLEFDKGVLLLNSLPEFYRIFALEFSKNLQDEYKCDFPSERSLVEVITLNFIRVLEIQKLITNKNRNMSTRYDIQHLAVLSKELDRAERHYLSSLQTLRMLKSPALEVNIKTQTAIVGQNQVVQSNNPDDKAI